MPRRLAILGSTGSIGVQALDVVSRSQRGELDVVALSAASGWEQLLEQARRYRVRRIALTDPDAAARAAEAWTDGEVLVGPDGLVRTKHLLTGIEDRASNMVEFSKAAITLLDECLGAG